MCGEHHFTGKRFDHRKPWLVERLALLAEVFAIDIAAYAVMSNHYQTDSAANKKGEYSVEHSPSEITCKSRLRLFGDLQLSGPPGRNGRQNG